MKVPGHTTGMPAQKLDDEGPMTHEPVEQQPSSRPFVVAADAPGVRRRAPSIANIDTKVLKLSPQFLAQLGVLAPKKRPGKIRWVVALALFAVATLLVIDPALRHWAWERGHGLYARYFAHPTPAVVAAGGPSAVPALDPVATIPTVADSAITTASAAPAVPVADPAAAAPSASTKAAPKKPGGKGRPGVRAGGRG